MMPALGNQPRIRGQDRDLVYLLQLARRHNLTASTLHDSLQSTWRRGKARCGELLIEIRLRGEGSSTYMFSAKGQPLAQANIQNDSIKKLAKLPEEFSHLLDEDKPSDSPKLDPGAESAIGNLRYGLNAVSFKAQVVKKSEVRAVTSKDGTPLLVCDVTLSDETGQIPLAVWNSQIGTISEGDLVQVQNVWLRSFRGERQLSLRKTGLLTVLEPASREHLKAA